MSISAIKASVQAERAKHQKNLDAAKKNFEKASAQADTMISKAKAELEDAAKKLQGFESEVKEALNPSTAATPRAATPKAPLAAAPKKAAAKKTAAPKKAAAKAAPKKTAAKKATAKAAPKKAAAKAAPKKAAKGKAGPKPAASKRAAEGRRAVAEGKRPPIKDAMAQVMGGETLNADEIHARLETKGWLPNAKNPRAYVAYLLSATKEKFERVPSKGRGFYKVAGTTSKVNGHSKKSEKSDTPAAPKSEAKVEKSDEGEAGGKRSPTADEVLAGLGFKPGEESSAFGG